MIYTDNKDFYPTPKALFRRLMSGKRFLDGLILEPSAGKGDMIRYIIDMMGRREGFGFIGVELTEEYIPIIEARVGVEAEAGAKE